MVAAPGSDVPATVPKASLPYCAVMVGVPPVSRRLSTMSPRLSPARPLSWLRNQLSLTKEKATAGARRVSRGSIRRDRRRGSHERERNQASNEILLWREGERPSGQTGQTLLTSTL